MARMSSIDRLGAELQERIGTMRADGSTIDEIMAHLRGLGIRVSRSALGRHVQHLDAARPEAIGHQLAHLRRAVREIKALLRESHGQ